MCRQVIFQLLYSGNRPLDHILIANFILSIFKTSRTLRAVGRHFNRDITTQLATRSCMLIKLIGPTANLLLNQLIAAGILFHVHENLIHHFDQRLRTSPAFGEAIRLKIGKLSVNQIKNLSDSTTPTKNCLFQITNTKERLDRIRFCRHISCERLNHTPLTQ